MRIGHDRCHWVDAHTPWLMFVGSCCMSFAYVACLMRTGHNWCRFALTMFEFPWSMRTTHPQEWLCDVHKTGRCRQSMKNSNGSMWTSHNRCGRSMTDVSYQMQRCVIRHFMAKAHRPWLMFPVAPRRCPPTNAQTPRLSTRHGWCVQTLDNFIFHLSMSSPRRSMQATNDLT